MIMQVVIPKLIIWMDLTDDQNKKVSILLPIKALPVISGSPARTASPAGAGHGISLKQEQDYYRQSLNWFNENMQ
jgi:hypothetical protein